MEKILKIAEKMGADACEIFYSSTMSHSFSITGSIIKTKEFDSDSGFGVRVLKDKKIGFSYFTEHKKAEDAVKTAISISKFSNKIPGFHFSEDKNFAEIKGIYDKKIAELGSDDAKNLIDDLITGVKQHAEPIESDLNFGVLKVRIINSNGLDACENSTKISCSTQAGYKDSSAHEGYASCKFDIECEKIGKSAGFLAKKMYKPEKMKTGKINVIFNKSALHDLFSTMLLPAVNGNNTRRGLSFFSGKLETMVADGSLSIYDDPAYPGGIGTSAFDEEGSRTFKKPIMENGLIKNFLYDLKNAALTKKEGKTAAKTTGNAGRGNYSSPVSISSSNLVVVSNKKNSIPDLIAECNDGIYLYSALGWHTANSLTGDFSVSVDTGFKIEDGEIKSGVSGIIADNFFEMIKKIRLEKKQERYADLITPKIEFKNVGVVGD